MKKKRERIFFCFFFHQKKTFPPPNTDLPKGTIVALHAEGKEHAMAIGEMVMSGLEIKEVNKGIGVNLIHYLNDGLWHMPEIS